MNHSGLDTKKRKPYQFIQNLNCNTLNMHTDWLIEAWCLKVTAHHFSLKPTDTFNQDTSYAYQFEWVSVICMSHYFNRGWNIVQITEPYSNLLSKGPKFTPAQVWFLIPLKFYDIDTLTHSGVVTLVCCICSAHLALAIENFFTLVDLRYLVSILQHRLLGHEWANWPAW